MFFGGFINENLLKVATCKVSKTWEVLFKFIVGMGFQKG